MNIGQIYETVLGWAGLKMGRTYATPIFDGATEGEAVHDPTLTVLPDSGRAFLHDDVTGYHYD